MEFIETVRGKPSLLYKGYSYRKYRENKQGVVTWVCSKERFARCKGRLVTQDNVEIRAVVHDCVPDEAYLDVKKAVFSAKKRAREDSETPIRTVFQQEVENLQNKGYELVTSVPQFSKVKSCLYVNRNKAQGLQNEPKLPEEVVLDDEFLKMTDGSSFLLADDGNKDRILIFAGRKAVDAIQHKKCFFMNGIFKSCSGQFTQIYTMHVYLGSNASETNVTPVLFALLPDKKKATYVRMFRMILDQVPRWNPEQVIIDFEISVVDALKEVFPCINIQGCYFHFTQCLWRKVQDVGLAPLYSRDEEIRRTIRMSAALAFLKPEDVDAGWIFVQGQTPPKEKVTEFFEYFVDQWLENPAFLKEMWSCYSRRHRTNNSVEGWNHKINSILGRPHPKIKVLIKCLMSEAEVSNQKITRMELNLEGVKRKKKYVKLDERIARSTQRDTRTTETWENF